MRPIHPSWGLMWVCLGVVAGVAVVPFIGQAVLFSTAWLWVALLVCGAAMWRQRVYVVPVLVIGGMLLGGWRGSIAAADLAVYDKLVGARVSVSGVVSEDVSQGRKGEKILRLSSVRIDEHQLRGVVWVSTYDQIDAKRGDIVTAEGEMKAGFGSFAAALHRAQVIKIQRPEPGDVARRVRDWFAGHIRVAIPDPQAALGIGYLVGQRQALPAELSEALQIAGLTHIVVASGYNLTILVRLARRLFMRISKYAATLAAGGMIASFIAMTGASPSMARAGLVAFLSLLAWYYGRKFHPAALLAFAAAVTVMINPSYVWGDLGWQLSFAAFAGVMLLAPLGQAYFFGDTPPGTVRQILGETIAAQMVTLPILIYAFGEFSNVALIANLLVLPLVPLAMLLTFLGGVSGIVAPSIAGLIGLPADWLLRYMIAVSHYVAELPWAMTEVTIQWWYVAGAYVVIIGLVVYLQRATRYDLHESSIIE